MYLTSTQKNQYHKNAIMTKIPFLFAIMCISADLTFAQQTLAQKKNEIFDRVTAQYQQYIHKLKDGSYSFSPMRKRNILQTTMKMTSTIRTHIKSKAINANPRVRPHTPYLPTD